MALTFTFEITTPERTVYRDEVEQVTLPTTTGQITILPNHVPLVSVLVPGEMVVRRRGEETRMAVTGGFVEVRRGNQVVLLADAAERAEEIDVARAEEARVRAEKIVAGKHEDAEKYAEALGALQRSLARLRVAERKRHRGRHQVGSEGVLHDT